MTGAPPPRAATPPRITVVVPCYNEERYIRGCLDSVLDDYVLRTAEILVIDGMSVDGTREIVREYERRHPIVRLLDNPGRLQAHGLNTGIRAARGEIIVRLDAHSTYPPGYVATCVRLLETTDAENVGGVMQPRGTTPFTRAVARAMMHPLGIGGAKFHHGDFSGYVDTCYLGTFHRAIFDRVGYYDANAHPAEDAELNCRILEDGGRVYLNSAIRVDYQPRSSWTRLARQFFGYGRGRCFVILRHGRLFSFGRLAPPALVLALVSSLLLALAHPAFLLIPALYVSAELTAGLYLQRREGGWFRQGLLQGAVLITMHVSYGTGFLLKLLRVIP